MYRIKHPVRGTLDTTKCDTVHLEFIDERISDKEKKMSALSFVIFASLVITVTVSVSLMCPESVPTVSFVSRCPSNAKEWKSASFRKRCDDVGKIQKCTKAENFVYHCVLNDEATALLEVCAPLYFISGYCARYSIEDQKMINDPRLDCTKFDPPCPIRFQSNESYKYQLCYTNTSHRLQLPETFDPHEHSRSFHQEKEESTTTTIVYVLLVIFVIITLSLLSLLFVGYNRNWIEFSCGNTKLNDEEDKIEATELMKDQDSIYKSARDEINEDVVPEKIKETVDINGDHCKDIVHVDKTGEIEDKKSNDDLSEVAEKTGQRKMEKMHDNSYSVADGCFHENKNGLSIADLSKSELDRYSRKDTNDEEKKTKLGDPKEQGDEQKKIYTSRDVLLLNELEDEGEDYVNIKEPTDRVTNELHSSIYCNTNCDDSEFEKHSGEEPAEFTPVKDTCNTKKYTMSYDPKTHRDSRGEIHDEDLRPGNYDEIKIRLAKYKQIRTQEPLSAIDFGTSDSKRKEEHTLIGSLQRMDLLMDEAKLFERWTPAETVPEHFEFEVEKDRFELFAGKNSVFSMWYPCTFIVDGKTYNCVEQYMVHRKAEIMNDTELAEVIMALNDPREIRESGKEVKNFSQQLWDDCCEAIVEAGNIEKFSQNKGLKEKLCNTIPKLLVEANPYDTKWAIGLSKDDTKALDPLKWKGNNLLGKILTRVRDELC
ncbi:uncharacterized protein [Magallana gigas]|uniref:uncharacterized protein isoform X2 n=1 Tax=Magallana gigas TaxID=29159 RepID=UPI003340A1B3